MDQDVDQITSSCGCYLIVVLSREVLNTSESLVMDSGGEFKFRQRAGKLNWAKLEKIDVEDVIRETRIGDLQSVLDNLVFSDVNKSDLRSQGQQNVSCMVRMMQLMLEYLLHGQEYQAGLVTKMHAKYRPMKKRVEKLETDNAFMREDIKVYKRQLHGLRARLQAEGKPTDLPSDYGLQVVEVPAPAPAPAPVPVPVPSEEEKKEEAVSLSHKDIELRLLISRLFEQQRELIEDKVIGHTGHGSAVEQLNDRMDEMQNMLVSTIDQVRASAGVRGMGTPLAASPFRKKARSSVDSDDAMDKSDRSFNLSLSSNGTTPQRKTPPRQVMTQSDLKTAQVMEEDLEREIAMKEAKREAALQDREREVNEKLSRIHLIEKSVLQSQVVMERERLALVEEKYALTPLKQMQAQMQEIETSKSVMEEQRRKDDEKRRAEEQEAESRKKQEQGVREREIAAKIIKARLHAISWKKLLNRFRKWTQVTLNRRDMEAFVKQQNALEKVKQLEEASKAAASESELKERELLERLEREKEELARRDEELDAAHSKEKEEDARRYAALMAQEAAKIAEETRKRVEEEKRREEAQAKALAEASRKEMNVQTSIDFDALASNDAADEERRATQRTAEQMLLELGLESGVAVTQDELMKRAQSRVEANKQAHMPSKMDLKEGLEREMRARLEKKKGQGTSAK